jgi:transketolase
VEPLAALRAIPNLLVFRPADAVETLEAWEVAVTERARPSVLALSRQNLPALRTAETAENLVAKGAYEIAPAAGEAVVSIFATGSEVSLAVAAKAILEAAGHPTRVVSVPSFELFAAQPEGYRAAVIGTATVKVAVEAAIRQGWDAIIGSDGIFVGMSGFGLSGPAEKVYAHFGITEQAVAEKARAALAKA